MSKNIMWAVEGQIKPGKKDLFTQVMTDLVHTANNELVTIIYEWTVAANGTDIHIYERYEDEVAAQVHLGAWSQNGPRFTDVVQITQITVFSALSQELRAAFAGPETVFMSPMRGFIR